MSDRTDPGGGLGPEERVDRQIEVRHVVIGVGAALVVGIALVVGVGHAAGFDDVRATLGRAEFAWLVVCALGQVVVFGGYTGAMSRAIASEGGPEVPPWLTLRVVFASFAATQVLAFGGIGGLAIVYWALRRAGLERAAAATRLIGLSTAIYLVFGVIGWCAAAVALATGSLPLGMTVPWLVVIPVVLLASRWFTDPGRVERWTAPSEGLVRRGLAIGVGAAAWVRRSLRTPATRPLFGWGICYWLGDILSLWGALHAFGVRLPIGTLVLVYATGYVAQAVPIPLIATGGVDAATTFLLQAAGVPLETALLAVVAHRIFAFWLPVIPGIVFAVGLPRTGRLLQETAGSRSRRAGDDRAGSPVGPDHRPGGAAI